MPTPHIVHVALADARGHLMRAHLLRELLGSAGVVVDVVTTQQAGVDFLAALGTPAALLPGGFQMEVDGRHRLQLGRTRRRLVRYAMADLASDVRALQALTAGAALVVNDSFHPALLAAHRVLPRARVVHLHGENLKATVVDSARPLRVARWLARGFAEVVHTLEPVNGLAVVDVGVHDDRRSRVTRLPPLVALPRRDRATVRAGVERLAAVYLNPHCRDPAIADVVEAACAAAGFTLRGVSEAFAHRPGWSATDAHFVDVVAAADVFISGAGMGALEQARVTGTPLVCLLGDQQEQTKNVIDRGLAHVFLDDAQALHHLTGALSALPAKSDVDGAREIARVQALWTATFVALLKEARHEEHEDPEHHQRRPRHRDQQPAGRIRRRRHLFGATARAPGAADATAVVAG